MSEIDIDELRKLCRRLRIGFIGGGRDSVIGGTHLAAMRVDGFFELYAGVFSIDPTVSEATARAEFLDADRVYESFNEMAEKEALREDGIEVVLIAAPPHIHFEAAKVFLTKGIDVICEKPIAVSREQASQLDNLAQQHSRLFCLTHCYTVIQWFVKSAMVRSGQLGKIRILEGN